MYSHTYRDRLSIAINVFISKAKGNHINNLIENDQESIRLYQNYLSDISFSSNVCKFV